MGSKTGLKIEEECCRIALIIELTYLVTLMSKRSGPLNAGRLQKALGRIGPRPRDVVEQELLLWLMVTALLAANEKDADEPLTQKAVELALDLKINTYTKLVCLMARFIWIEKLQEPPLHEFWARIAIASDWISPSCPVFHRRSGAAGRTRHRDSDPNTHAWPVWRSPIPIVV
jgi:hypothetical protein